MSTQSFQVHSDHQIQLSRQWMIESAQIDAEMIDAEDLGLVSIEEVQVHENGLIWFECRRLKPLAGKVLHWDLLDAVDQAAYQPGELAAVILAAIFSRRDSFTIRLEEPVFLARVGGEDALVDGINWCESTHSVTIRLVGSHRFFDIELIPTNVPFLRALLVELAHSMATLDVYA